MSSAFTLELPPFGQGMGAVGLPGDWSPASRFVRAAFLKWNSACQPDERVDAIFHQHLKVTTPIPTLTTEEAIRGKEVFQLTPFIDEAQEAEVRPHIPHCEIGRWHPAFTDVTALGNTKQRGMDEIIRHFGIRLEDTLAFGDGGNDIPMLRHAGIGIAMGNAADHVKAAADYVTTSVDEDGVAEGIQQWLMVNGKW